MCVEVISYSFSFEKESVAEASGVPDVVNRSFLFFTLHTNNSFQWRLRVIETSEAGLSAYAGLCTRSL